MLNHQPFPTALHSLMVEPYRPVLPAEPNYQVTGQVCGQPVAFMARLPVAMPLEGRFWMATRAIFKAFVDGPIGGGYSIEDCLRDHRFVFRPLEGQPT